MKKSYGHELGHYGVHIHEPKCIYISSNIDVSRDEYKLHEVTN